MHLPFYMVIVLVLHGAYYPVLIPFFLYTSWSVVLAVFAAKLLLQSIFIYVCLKQIGRSSPWWLYLLFEIYLVVTSVILIIFFFLPVKVRWKGRSY
jgi:hypothetical protein